MAKVIWSKIALEDLRSIHEYISKDSPTYANNQIERIIERVEQIESFPKSGRIVPEFQIENIRELIEGSYRIVYEIESIELIGIARIHHSAKLLNPI